MRIKISDFTSCPAVLALAVCISAGLASCSKDDDNEPSIDELLSDKTTPVTFDFGKQGAFVLYDYAGSHYVGSETVSKFEKGKTTLEVELRQGNHHLLWFEGIDNGTNASVRFDPEKTVIISERQRHIIYAECDVNVGEYLLPTQKLVFKPLTAGLNIFISDGSKVSKLVKQELNQYVDIGVIKGLPKASTISLHGREYIASKNPIEINLRSYYNSGSSGPGYVIYPSFSVSAEECKYILCPEDGIDNIQLTAEVQDASDNAIATTTLPKCSIKRGYITVLTGPLFSGTTSDWEVTMLPYSDL